MRKITAYLILLSAVFFLQPSIASADLYGQVSLSYQETETTTTGQSAKKSVYTQGYTIGGMARLTSTLTISADVRYTITDTDGEEERTTYPQFTLNYSPPSLANFSFGYTRTEVAPSDGVHLSTSNLYTSYSFPTEGNKSLDLFFNRQTSEDNETPRLVDTTATRFGLNTGYGLTVLDYDTHLHYAFSQYNQKDDIADEKTETPSHSITADASKAFWDGNVKTYLNVGYSLTERTHTSLGAPSRFAEPLVAANGLFAIDATPSNGALAETQGLIDGPTDTVITSDDLNNTIDIDLLNINNNIGVKLDYAQAVHEIHVYIKTDDNNIANYASTIGWQLYTSPDGLSWSTHVSQLFYDKGLYRFRFTFNEVTSQYFKVVNTTAPAITFPINVTEIDPIGYRLDIPSQSATDETTRNFGGFNLTVTPNKRVRLVYNLNYDRSLLTQEETHDKSTENSSITHGLNLTLEVLPQYLTVTTSYSTANEESIRKETGYATVDTENGRDSYTLGLNSRPLPTVNGNLNYSHFDNLTDGEKISTSDNIDLNVSMMLYRGVDVSVGASMSETEDIRTGSMTDSTNRYANINLVPFRDLNILLNAIQSTSETETAGGVKSSSTGKTLNASASYTPTRRLYLSANIAIEPVSSQAFALSWIPTRTIQASLNHGRTEDFTTRGASVNWTPFTKLTLFVGYNLSESKNSSSSKTESLSARASLRF